GDDGAGAIDIVKRAGAEVVMIGGLGDCEKCADMNSVLGLARDGSFPAGESFYVLADLLLINRVYAGAVHVRADEDNFRQFVLPKLRAPRRAPPMFVQGGKGVAVTNAAYERYQKKM